MVNGSAGGIYIADQKAYVYNAAFFAPLNHTVYPQGQPATHLPSLESGNGLSLPSHRSLRAGPNVADQALSYRWWVVLSKSASTTG